MRSLTIWALLALCLLCGAAAPDQPGAKELTGWSTHGPLAVNIYKDKDERGRLSVYYGQGELVSRRTFDMEAVGGYSGFFMAADQPLKHWLILTKEGGYDGRTLLINRATGDLVDLPGGSYLIDQRGDYLFSFHHTDVEQLITVYSFGSAEVECASAEPDRLIDRAGKRIVLPDQERVYPAAERDRAAQ